MQIQAPCLQSCGVHIVVTEGEVEAGGNTAPGLDIGRDDENKIALLLAVSDIGQLPKFSSAHCGRPSFSPDTLHH